MLKKFLFSGFSFFSLCLEELFNFLFDGSLSSGFLNGSFLYCFRSLFLNGGSLLGSSLLSSKLFCILGNNCNRNTYFYLLVEVNNSLVFADTLSVTHGNDFTVNFDTLFSQSSNNLSSTYRTVELTGNADLCGNLESNTLECLSLILGSSFLGSELVSLLAHILSKHLLCSR